MQASKADSHISEIIVPRHYQEEIFERARQENIIAALSTGSGKTFISLLLIKWIFAQPASTGKVVIFLVPKVTLVEQQGNFIARNTPLRVIKLYGALDIDLTERSRWQKRFAQYDVFVMTAQIFLNMLTHSIWSIDKVSLMIFDECHHARKNHPYNGIMREYFYVDQPTRRPKIFGMTASPIWDPKNAESSLAGLEANLNAKVIGVRAHVDELSEHSPSPVEIVKEYGSPPALYDYPSPTLWSALQALTHDITLWDELDIPWKAIGLRYYSTLNNLGPYSASYFLYSEIRQHSIRALTEYQDTMRTMTAYSDMDILPSSSAPTYKTLPSEFWIVQEILSDFEPFFADPPTVRDTNTHIPPEWCTPKVRALIEILLAYHSPTFQGIVFVEQRHIAACLSKMLNAIPDLKSTIRSTWLVGQGVGSDGKPNSMIGGQDNAVESFRKGDANLLIATSVAEEGLDFPSCDLVVRFDPLQHMVGYVQSRGRARNKKSTFVIMIEQNNMSHLSRYQMLQEREPDVNRAYRTRHVWEDNRDDSEMDDNDEETSTADLAKRERFVVPSSGAVLTYDNAIGLLHYLCALIPRDAFTPQHIPRFTGDFQATLRLPSSIPLDPAYLTFTGPCRNSKREAKRAVAFMAVKRLHELDVFDKYLLPTTGINGNESEDTDGRPMRDVSKVPITMKVQVKDPWTIGPRLWLHNVHVDNRPVAGLVTGTTLPPVDLRSGGLSIRTGIGKPLAFEDEEDESRKRESMREFTGLGIWFRITGRLFTESSSLFVVPLADDLQPDYQAIDRLIANPYGSRDWSSIGENHYDKLLVMNDNEFGRPRLLHRIRRDLTPMSKPDGSEYPTYYALYMDKWTRKKRAATVPSDGPLVETLLLPRFFDGTYSLYPAKESHSEQIKPEIMLIPQGCLRWIHISWHVCRVFETLPALCHRVTDIYRAQHAKFSLSLPAILDDRLVEALTIPSTSAGYSNQRLETLGDAVLELCTTVHLFNKYPHRHEGQLTTLRKEVVSNRYLLARAKDVDLEMFITSETQSVHVWRYIETDERFLGPFPSRSISRFYPRRSLQDCMEAILGAAFITGGISMALGAGDALGLSFGGASPWPSRYPRDTVASPASVYFQGLEERLGYTFQRTELLLEAITHPSFTCESSGPSYQRLEFLGDGEHAIFKGVYTLPEFSLEALLDLVVVHYLYCKFPEATSEQLARPKAKAVCAPALASLAVRQLNLHKLMLFNRQGLSEALDCYVPILQATTGEEVVKRGWRYDPPKALSDVFESVIGAVFVDSNYDYEKAAAIVEHIMEDVLLALSPSLKRDPVSELVEWLAGSGCTKIAFAKKPKLKGGIQNDGIAVLVHDIIVAGPIVATSSSVAKFVASERALVVLSDPEAENSLARVCSCGKAMIVDSGALSEEGKQPTVHQSNTELEQQTHILAIVGSDTSDTEEVEEVAAFLTQVGLEWGEG